MTSRASRFLSELKRRKVDRAAAVYAVIGLGVIEAANNIFPWLFVPTWVNQLVLWPVLAGFPVALVVAWLTGQSRGSGDAQAESSSGGTEAEAVGHWTQGRVLISLAVFLAIVFGGWFVFGRDRGPDLVAERIVVAPFRNLTGVDSLDVVGDMAAYWLSDDLQRAGGVEVVAADVAIEASSLLSADGSMGNRDRVRGLAQEVGAGTVISGTYVLERDSLRFRAEIIDAQARRLLAEMGPVSGSIHEPTETLTRLQQLVKGALAVHHFRSENLEAIEDYNRAYEFDTLFLEPLAASIISHNNSGDFEAGDSVFDLIEPRLEELTPYYQLHIRGERARRLGQREEHLRLLRQELELYPGSAAPYSVAWAERNSNHPRRAIELLTTMDPERGSMREFFAYWTTMTDSYHMLGEHGEELRQAQRAEPLYPERLIRPLDRQAIALGALGRLEELRALLDRVETLPAFGSTTPGEVMRHAAMELRAHGHRAAATEVFDRARSWYASRPSGENESRAQRYAIAQLHYGAEHWEDARSIAEELVAEDPSNHTYQGFLGLVAAHGGDRDEALVRMAWLTEFRPQFFPSQPFFWRSLIASALGDMDDAMRLLQEALDRGLNWRNQHPSYHSFEPLYDLPAYQELMRPKG